MILTQASPNQDNIKYPHDDEEYEEDLGHTHSQGEAEEIEYYPLVWYHLPTKKPDLKQEQLRAESFKKRNQQIQERKETAKQIPIKPLHFLQGSENRHLSFEKNQQVAKAIHSGSARLLYFREESSFHPSQRWSDCQSLSFDKLQSSCSRKGS